MNKPVYFVKGADMAVKNSAKVMIDGKIITLGGYESEEYLQRVANFVNRKIAEMESMTSFRRMTPDMRSCMMAINLADDYFKAKEQADAAEQEMETKDKEAYNVKQDLIAAQMEIERLKKELSQYKKQ